MRRLRPFVAAPALALVGVLLFASPAAADNCQADTLGSDAPSGQDGSCGDTAKNFADFIAGLGAMLGGLLGFGSSGGGRAGSGGPSGNGGQQGGAGGEDGPPPQADADPEPNPPGGNEQDPGYQFDLKKWREREYKRRQQKEFERNYPGGNLPFAKPTPPPTSLRDIYRRGQGGGSAGGGGGAASGRGGSDESELGRDIREILDHH